MLNALGVILFFLGLALLAHAQIVIETSIENSSFGLDDYSAPSRIVNIDLVAQKLINTFVSGILIISGLVIGMCK